MWKDILPILGWRMVGALSSFVFNVLTIRLIIETYGADDFAAISVVLALPALLPFADLGMANSVINAGTDIRDRPEDEPPRLRLAAAQRVLLGVGAALVSLSLLLFIVDGWAGILGPAATDTPGIAVGATLTTAAVGLGVINSTFSRLLQGWRRNALLIAVSAAVPPLAFVAAWTFITVGAPAGLLASTTAIAMVLLGVVYWVPVSRRYPGSLLHDLFRRRPKRADFVSVLSVGVSGLAVSIGTAISFQSDRLLLSFQDSATELAQYSVVAPLFAAGWATISPIGQNLWPKYRRLLRDRQMTERELSRGVLALGGVAIFGGAAIIALGPLVTFAMSDGQVRPPQVVYWYFSILLLVQACQMPASMVLSSRRGFVVQRNAALLTAGAKIGLSVALLPSMGLPAVLLASILAVMVIQIPLTAFAALRTIRSSDSAQE